MNKLFLFISAFFLISLSTKADRKGTMEIAGQMCEFDTIAHRKIGPGTKYTAYQFNKIKNGKFLYKMRVQVFEVDMANQYNKVIPYLSNDEYYSLSTQVKEYARREKLGEKPFASISGTYFQTTDDDTARKPLYEMWGSCFSDGLVYFENNTPTLNFYETKDRTVNFGYTTFMSSLRWGGVKLEISDVNHCRDFADDLNSIALFCNGVPESFSTDNKKGVDVRIKNVSSGNILLGNNTCQVIEVLDGCGHKVNKGEAILSASGEQTKSLSTLKPGDIVEINLGYQDELNQPVEMQNLMSPNASTILKEGVITPWGARNTAFGCIGKSKDGKTLYLTDIEINDYSNAPSDFLGYLLKYIGVWTAYWMDGGPSAEVEVAGEWVTTNSLGYGYNGRYIPGALMLFSTAPNDNNVVALAAEDPSPKNLVLNESINITLYGYNKYDDIILPDAQLSDIVSITCTSDLGTIENGVFTSTKVGKGEIQIFLHGSSTPSVRIPVEVADEEILSATPKNIFTGELRPCQAKLAYTKSGKTTEVNPAEATWTSANKSVVRSCDAGRIMPYVDGFSDVYVEYQGLRDTIHVTVENLENEDVETLDFTSLISSDTYYDIQLTSVPRSFEATFKVFDEENNLVTDRCEGETVTLYYQTGDSVRNVTTQIRPDGTAAFTIFLDFDAAETYPVTILNSIFSSKEYNCTMTSLLAWYVERDPSSISSPSSSASSTTTLHYDLSGKAVSRQEYEKSRLKKGNIIIKQ